MSHMVCGIGICIVFWWYCWKILLRLFHQLRRLWIIWGGEVEWIVCVPISTINLVDYVIWSCRLLSLSQYTGCPRRNVPDFGRVFLMLKYTDITQNTYSQSWTVTEIMAREVWNFDSCYTLIDYQIHIKTGRNMLFL